MNRAIAASVLCLCMAEATWADEAPDSMALYGSITVDRYLSPIADTNGSNLDGANLLLTGLFATEPRVVLNPSHEQEEVRRFITGIERMHNRLPQLAEEVDFALIEWRSLQETQVVNEEVPAQTSDSLALREATVIAPPVGDAYRSTDRWLKSKSGRSSDVQAPVDYTNQAERKKADGGLREVDPPFPTVLWLLGVVLMAMATISRRSRPV